MTAVITKRSEWSCVCQNIILTKKYNSITNWQKRQFNHKLWIEEDNCRRTFLKCHEGNHAWLSVLCKWGGLVITAYAEIGPLFYGLCKWVYYVQSETGSFFMQTKLIILHSRVFFTCPLTKSNVLYSVVVYLYSGNEVHCSI